MKRIGWRHYPMPLIGQARGFLNTAFNLYREMGLSSLQEFEVVDIGERNIHKHHLRRAGLDAVFHFCPPHRYQHVDWAPNFLFSMWETDVMPEPIAEVVRQAEHHFVPSRYCAEIWRRHGMTAEVIPLGVGKEILALDTSRQLLRGEGTSRIRFLVVSSSNQRKGWQLIAPAWRLAFENRPKAVSGTQLYLKLIGESEQERSVEYPYPDQRTAFDSRDLSEAELAELYGSADVFVAPSYGEGFGLPALEAMAAGCLVVAPMVGGMTEFVSPLSSIVIPRTEEATIDYGVPVKTMVPSAQGIAECLQTALLRWGSPALEAVRRHGCARAREFTWQASGETLHRRISGILAGAPIQQTTTGVAI